MIFYFIYISLLFLTKFVPASLSSSQAHIVKRGLLVQQCLFSASNMPGDPTVLEEVSTALSAADLLIVLAVKLPPF